MPEKEFELYLSLLGRFLRLDPRQRTGVADELRDHLEARLDELAARGLSREEAIHTALEELGDAAELAHHFTRAAQSRRRRLLMRCTYGTVAALAATLLIATAFWPDAPQGPAPKQVVAQTTPPAAAAAEVRREAAAGRPTAEERIQAKLDDPTEVIFLEQPLEDAITFLKDFHKVNIIIDRGALADHGVPLDQAVSLSLSGVSFRSVLKILLEPLDLTYVIQDEVMKITTPANANEIRVYNVRDLVGARGGVPAMVGVPAGGDEELPAPVAASGHAKPAGPMANSVADVISRTVAPGTWGEGKGVILEYNGMLVVKNSHMVHVQVARLLEMMRSSLHMRGGAADPAPVRNPGAAPVPPANSATRQITENVER